MYVKQYPRFVKHLCLSNNYVCITKTFFYCFEIIILQFYYSIKGQICKFLSCTINKY